MLTCNMHQHSWQVKCFGLCHNAHEQTRQLRCLVVIWCVVLLPQACMWLLHDLTENGQKTDVHQPVKRERETE